MFKNITSNRVCSYLGACVDDGAVMFENITCYLGECRCGVCACVLVVDLMICLRDPVRVIQFAKRSRSRIVRQFVRSVEFPVALTPLSLTDSAENRAMACIP